MSSSSKPNAQFSRIPSHGNGNSSTFSSSSRSHSVSHQHSSSPSPFLSSSPSPSPSLSFSSNDFAAAALPVAHQVTKNLEAYQKQQQKHNNITNNYNYNMTQNNPNVAPQPPNRSFSSSPSPSPSPPSFSSPNYSSRTLSSTASSVSSSSSFSFSSSSSAPPTLSSSPPNTDSTSSSPVKSSFSFTYDDDDVFELALQQHTIPDVDGSKISLPPKSSLFNPVSDAYVDDLGFNGEIGGGIKALSKNQNHYEEKETEKEKRKGNKLPSIKEKENEKNHSMEMSHSTNIPMNLTDYDDNDNDHGNDNEKERESKSFSLKRKVPYSPSASPSFVSASSSSSHPSPSSPPSVIPHHPNSLFNSAEIAAKRHAETEFQQKQLATMQQQQQHILRQIDIVVNENGPNKHMDISSPSASSSSSSPSPLSSSPPPSTSPSSSPSFLDLQARVISSSREAAELRMANRNLLNSVATSQGESSVLRMKLGAVERQLMETQTNHKNTQSSHHESHKQQNQSVSDQLSSLQSEREAFAMDMKHRVEKLKAVEEALEKEKQKNDHLQWRLKTISSEQNQSNNINNKIKMESNGNVFVKEENITMAIDSKGFMNNYNFHQNHQSQNGSNNPSQSSPFASVPQSSPSFSKFPSHALPPRSVQNPSKRSLHFSSLSSPSSTPSSSFLSDVLLSSSSSSPIGFSIYSLIKNVDIVLPPTVSSAFESAAKDLLRKQSPISLLSPIDLAILLIEEKIANAKKHIEITKHRPISSPPRASHLFESTSTSPHDTLNSLHLCLFHILEFLLLLISADEDTRREVLPYGQRRVKYKKDISEMMGIIMGEKGKHQHGEKKEKDNGVNMDVDEDPIAIASNRTDNQLFKSSPPPLSPYCPHLLPLLLSLFLDNFSSIPFRCLSLFLRIFLILLVDTSPSAVAKMMENMSVSPPSSSAQLPWFAPLLSSYLFSRLIHLPITLSSSSSSAFSQFEPSSSSSVPSPSPPLSPSPPPPSSPPSSPSSSSSSFSSSLSHSIELRFLTFELLDRLFEYKNNLFLLVEIPSYAITPSHSSSPPPSSLCLLEEIYQILSTKHPFDTQNPNSSPLSSIPLPCIAWRRLQIRLVDFLFHIVERHNLNGAAVMMLAQFHMANGSASAAFPFPIPPSSSSSSSSSSPSSSSSSSSRSLCHSYPALFPFLSTLLQGIISDVRSSPIRQNPMSPASPSHSSPSSHRHIDFQLISHVFNLLSHSFLHSIFLPNVKTLLSQSIRPIHHTLQDIVEFVVRGKLNEDENSNSHHSSSQISIPSSSSFHSSSLSVHHQYRIRALEMGQHLQQFAQNYSNEKNEEKQMQN